MIIKIPEAELESIARIFGDTSSGFSGSEIENILKICNLTDPGPITKWRRIYESLQDSQQKYQVGNHVGKFIEESMKPARHLKNKNLWCQWKSDINVILSLLGMELNEAGKIIEAKRIHTIDQALQKVSSFRQKLIERNVHHEIYKYCVRELIAENYFHAVFEACKGVTDKLSTISGIKKDGSELIDIIFSINRPIVAINSLTTESEKSEHKGFANLLKGVFGLIRNPLAHEAKVNWNMSEQDALDTFSMLSMIYRKIDIMVKIRSFEEYSD